MQSNKGRGKTAVCLCLGLAMNLRCTIIYKHITGATSVPLGCDRLGRLLYHEWLS